MRLFLQNYIYSPVTRYVGLLLGLLVAVQVVAAPVDLPPDPVVSPVGTFTNACGLLPPVLTPSALTVTVGNSVNITATGCPGGIIQYFGSMGVFTVAPGGTISVPTSTTGTMLISALCSFSGCISEASVATVTVRPAVGPNLTPVVSNTITSQSATVGSTFVFLIPSNTFTDPSNDPLTLTASGLPSGLFFNGSAIVGPVSATGVSSVTVTATNSLGLSATTTFPLVFSAPPIVSGPAALTITSFTCNSPNSVLSSVNFVVGYSDGTFTPALPPLFINGVTNAGQLGTRYTLNFDANTSSVPIQDNANRSTYFVWNFRAACAGTPPAPIAPVAPALPSQTATVGTPFSYVVPAFTGTAPITYTATNLPAGLTFNPGTRTISGTPTTVQTPTVTISASNVAGQSSGTFTIAVSASVTQPATLTITSFTCNTTNSVLSSVNFVVGYSNGLFTPTLPNLFINGVTNVGQLGTRYTFSFDANASALPIQDNASRSTYFVWDYRAACAAQNSRNRLLAEPVAPLQINMMGNPVNDVIEVEVSGAEGNSLNLMLSDMKGNTINQQRIERAGAKEQVRFNVSQQPAGLLLFRASTPTQTKAIRFFKTK